MELLKTSPPWLSRWVVDEDTAYNVLWRLRGRLAGSGVFLGSLRGWQMRERSDVFSQFSALLQFPPYFSNSWNAFVDGVQDLNWLRARGFVLVILEAADVLRDADDDEYALLLSVLSSTGAAMSQPTEFRAALPFHVVLQAAPQRAPELEARLAGAGHCLPPAAF